MQNPPSINESVAAELRAAAARKSVTGAALGRQLQDMGNAFIGPMWVHRRFSASVEISVEDLVLICDALGVYPLDVLAQALSTTGGEPAASAAP